MLLFDGALGVLAIFVWIFCVIDTIMTPQEQCRNLPKLAWVFIVLLFVTPGAIAWLVAGRPWNRVPAGSRTGGSWNEASAAGLGERPRRVPTNPDDDEEFLAGLRKRAEEQRRRAREADGDSGGSDSA
jgi:hypothetical protein